ncbi:hypothetical protein NPIL_169981 [Nephila pilipes]|uniref:Uncharacterized protein n=1 Tax=Nephila pilipes TaxID=299642 RepID=A0A8X6PTX4_NEPPI|nr:hypothetical protein NPIL_169981 [Nephila pilipes]
MHRQGTKQGSFRYPFVTFKWGEGEARRGNEKDPCSKAVLSVRPSRSFSLSMYVTTTSTPTGHFSESGPCTNARGVVTLTEKMAALWVIDQGVRSYGDVGGVYPDMELSIGFLVISFFCVYDSNIVASLRGEGRGLSET